MSSTRRRVLAGLGALPLVGLGPRASRAADEPLRVGLITTLSGPFAEFGHQMENGVRLWLRQRGDTVAGRRIELLLKDDTGAAPEVAKRLAIELATRDKVHVLAGFAFTPNAVAVAPVATQAKLPMLVMNAASAGLTQKSPYIARTSFTLPQVSAPMAQWAAKNAVRRVFTLVSDYAPGIDAETAFRKAFEAASGQVVDAVRVPLKNPEFAPFLQKIKDTKPDAVFVFLPSGEPAIAFMKGFDERGMKAAGIRLLATGDVTDDASLDAMGDAALGAITTHHWSMAHESPLAKAYVKLWTDAYGAKSRPNQVSVASWDGMNALWAALERTKGVADGDTLIGAIKGLRIDSPRGPVTLDAATRDIVQTVYVRRVEKRDGRLFNVEFDRFADVRADV
jgi:branched-chain amino acid transport system substrate-binding protein